MLRCETHCIEGVSSRLYGPAGVRQVNCTKGDQGVPPHHGYGLVNWVTTHHLGCPYFALTSFEEEAEQPWWTFYPRRRGLVKGQCTLPPSGRFDPPARLFATSTDWLLTVG